MRLGLPLLIAALVLLPASGYAQEPTPLPPTLTLDWSIAAARQSHPELNRWRSRIDASEARVSQARALRFPIIDLDAGYLREEADKLHDRPGNGNVLALRGEEYASSLSLNLMLLDFGRISSAVSARELDLEAARLDLEAADLALVLAVKEAYWGVLAARRALETAARSVANYEEHLAQAQAFFTAGAKPRYDVTKAEVDLSNERLKLSQAATTVKIAWVGLATLVGVDIEPDQAIEDSLADAEPSLSIDEVLARAYAGRPELLALEAREKAARKAVIEAEKEYWPTVTGGGGYFLAGPSFPLDRFWSADVRLSVNLFSGFARRSRVAERWAEARAARAAFEAASLALGAEVEESYLMEELARAVIGDAAAQVALARENLELAQLRYQSGVGSPIEVTDALVTMSRSELLHVQALYEQKKAQARLARAMGSRE